MHFELTPKTAPKPFATLRFSHLQLIAILNTAPPNNNQNKLTHKRKCNAHKGFNNQHPHIFALFNETNNHPHKPWQPFLTSPKQPKPKTFQLNNPPSNSTKRTQGNGNAREARRPPAMGNPQTSTGWMPTLGNPDSSPICRYQLPTLLAGTGS
jgi:hypothetical protein